MGGNTIQFITPSNIINKRKVPARQDFCREALGHLRSSHFRYREFELVWRLKVILSTGSARTQALPLLTPMPAAEGTEAARPSGKMQAQGSQLSSVLVTCTI